MKWDEAVKKAVRYGRLTGRKQIVFAHKFKRLNNEYWCWHSAEKGSDVELYYRDLRSRETYI